MVTARFTVDTSNWERELAAAGVRMKSPLPANRQVGDAVVGMVRRNFTTNGLRGDWQPLSPVTLLARARGRSGKAEVHKRGRGGKREFTANAIRTILGAKALIWSGRLLRSVTYHAESTHVDVGSNLKQAARLWFGWEGEQRWGKRVVHIKTPARNPLELSDSDGREITRIYINYFFEGLAR